MTISSTTRIAGPFVGNGTASVFPFTFKVFAAADLDVIRLTTSTGVETTLVLNSDYTVSLNGNQNTNPGGSVTLSAGALASGFTLTITSDIANLQPTDLTNQGGFYPEVITDSLDRATIQIQQISDIGDRAVKTPISDGILNMELPSATNRASKYLVFDANGLPSVSSGSGTDTSLRTDLANATVALAGSSLVGFRQSSANSVARTVLTKLRESQSVTDFGAVGDGVTDDTTAFTNAWTANTPNPVFIPGGSYAITGTITGTFITLANVTIVGGTVNTITRIGANATIPGTISVTGTSTFTGNSSFGGTLATTGDVTVGGNLTTTGDIIGNETITGDLAVTGGDITTTATGTATVFNTNATTVNIGGAASAVNVGSTSTGVVAVRNLSINAGYGSIAPVFGCRAWCYFNPGIAGTFAGGTATAARTAASNVCTITTTTPHGLIPNNYVRTTSNVIDSEATGRPYEVISTPTSTTFTVNTVATTAITTNPTVPFGTLTVVASGNVSSVVRAWTPAGSDSNGNYYVNFSTAMTDANFAACVTGQTVATTSVGGESVNMETRGQGIGHVRMLNVNFGGTANTDPTRVNLAVFR